MCEVGPGRRYSPTPGWGEDLLDTRRELPVGMEMVAVAYADWERAKSVPPAEVVKFAKRFRFKAFLLDTWGKDGKTLLDFMTAQGSGRTRGRSEIFAVAIRRSRSPGRYARSN